MDTPRTTPKDFFLWAGAMVAFYWSIVAYLFLVFDYIDYVFPDPLRYYPADPYQSGISGEMASIIVLLPVFLLLMHLIRGTIARDPSRAELWVRRWALILTLFVAGVAIVVDLIMLLTTFLSGEALTTAFLLKVLVVLLVAAGIFMHFIADLRDYWAMNPQKRTLVVYAVGALAVLTILAGFFIVGTPREARLARFDAQKVNDLQMLQSQVISYWQAKRALPEALTDLDDSLYYGPMPVDPQTGELYGYRVGDDALSFELCATFNTARDSQYGRGYPLAPLGTSIDRKEAFEDSWAHEEGQMCFVRTIDPSFYPPLR